VKSEAEDDVLLVEKKKGGVFGRKNSSDLYLLELDMRLFSLPSPPRLGN
jgi:hypothetical protein